MSTIVNLSKMTKVSSTFSSSFGRGAADYPNIVRASITLPKSGAPRATVYIGENILAKLPIKLGDYVDPIFDEDFIYIGEPAKEGTLVGSTGGAKSRRVKLTWACHSPCIFSDITEAVAVQTVEHFFYEGGLLIRWPKQNDAEIVQVETKELLA